MSNKEYACFSYFDLEFNKSDVDIICHCGDNENEVKEVIKKDYIQKQLNQIDIEKIRQCVNDYAIEDTENMNKQTLYQYIIWLGAWNCYDDRMEATNE